MNNRDKINFLKIQQYGESLFEEAEELNRKSVDAWVVYNQTKKEEDFLLFMDYSKTALRKYENAYHNYSNSKSIKMIPVVKKRISDVKALRRKFGKDKKKNLYLAYLFFGLLIGILVFYLTMLSQLVNNSNTSSVKDKESDLMYLNAQQEDYLLWEATTVMRSALYYYVLDYGEFPEDLSSLADYLDDYIAEPITLSKTIVTEKDNSGGWVYNPENVVSTKTTDMVAEALTPNVDTKWISFNPVQTIVDTKLGYLYITSGQTLINKYSVSVNHADKILLGNYAKLPQSTNNSIKISEHKPISITTTQSKHSIVISPTELEEINNFTPTNSFVYIRDNVYSNQYKYNKGNIHSATSVSDEIAEKYNQMYQ